MSPASAGTPSTLDTRPSLAGLSKAILTRLDKLGLRSQFDLVLHLPLRYDDETKLYPINAAPGRVPVLVEGSVVESDIKYRPRRQLVCHIEDGTGVLTLRFLNFYMSQLKQLAAGTRLRAFGEIRDGYLGPEMVHPQYRVVHGAMPVARALTPVYPTTAGLAQDELRRLIARALVECDLDDTLPPDAAARARSAGFSAMRCACCTIRPRVSRRKSLQERRHPAWRRVKFDELLAQQLSMRLQSSTPARRRARRRCNLVRS